MGFRTRFFAQERSTETSSSSVPEVPPVSCPKIPMTCQENPLAPRLCPAPTRPWALQATYAVLQCRKLSFPEQCIFFVSQAQSQRRVALPTTNSTLGVGVGTPGTLANSSLGSGWQVSEIHPSPFLSIHGTRSGEVLRPLPSVTSRRALPQLPPTPSQIKARCRFAPT